MKARRAGVPAIAAAIGALIATPAFADVTVSPASAVQGSGEDLTFHVTNTGSQPVGSVTLKLPDDTPVAEVYPLSVANWAPKIDIRTLSTPLKQEHGGLTTTQTASSITWLAVPGTSLAPGATADLAVAIGPMPTLSSIQFTLVTKGTDGKPGPAMPPATLKLTPATADQAAAAAAEHAGHEAGGTTTDGTTTGGTAADGSGTAGADQAAENAAFAQVVAEAQRGPSVVSMAGWVVAALLLLGGLVFILRGRHRAEEDDEPDDDEAAPGTDGKDPEAVADKNAAGAERVADTATAAPAEAAGKTAAGKTAAGKTAAGQTVKAGKTADAVEADADAAEADAADTQDAGRQVAGKVPATVGGKWSFKG